MNTVHKQIGVDQMGLLLGGEGGCVVIELPWGGEPGQAAEQF